MTTRKSCDSRPIENVTSKAWQAATFGSLVRALRMSEEISQVELAEKLGVSKQFLSGVELNSKFVSLSFVKKFAKALGFSVEPMIELLLRDQLKREGLEYDVSLRKRAS